MSMKFFDPTGGQPKVQQVVMANRFVDLKGLRFNILDNGKQNSRNLLSMVGDMLEKNYGATVVEIVTKLKASMQATVAELAEAVKGVDFVLTGTGD